MDKFCGKNKLVFQLIKEDPLNVKGCTQSNNKALKSTIDSSSIKKKFSKSNLISQIDLKVLSRSSTKTR